MKSDLILTDRGDISAIQPILNWHRVQVDTSYSLPLTLQGEDYSNCIKEYFFRLKLIYLASFMV